MALFVCHSHCFILKMTPQPLYISAAHKSSGKTTVTLGLIAALKKNTPVQVFKKGPDYIDPIWHHKASSRPCYNLDFNTMSHNEILSLYQQFAISSGINLIEGNKGLFDGISVDGSDSNAALVKLLNAKTILVLDTQGITRGIAPLVLGYQAFDQELDIAGIILNKVGGSRHEEKLRRVLEYYTDLKVLGAVPKHKAMLLDEKHLGLIPGNEDKHAETRIAEIGKIVEASVDLHKIRRLVAHDNYPKNDPDKTRTPTRIKKHTPDNHPPVRLAVIMDQAFGFYYQNDLNHFRAYQVEIIPCDAIHDKALPKNIDGLLIGGGFPERHMQALSRNRSFRQSIRDAIENGLPAYAECGGLMYLCRQIQWQQEVCPMVGVIAADVEMTSKPQGRGLIRFRENEHMLWPQIPSEQEGSIIAAHEFHFSRLVNLDPNLQFAYEIHRGHGIDRKNDAIIHKHLIASYAHLYHSHQNPWTHRFVQFILACKNAGHD